MARAIAKERTRVNETRRPRRPTPKKMYSKSIAPKVYRFETTTLKELENGYKLERTIANNVIKKIYFTHKDDGYIGVVQQKDITFVKTYLQERGIAFDSEQLAEKHNTRKRWHRNSRHYRISFKTRLSGEPGDTELDEPPVVKEEK